MRNGRTPIIRAIVSTCLLVGAFFVAVSGGCSAPGKAYERVTLLSGDKPKENFRRMHEIFPARRIAAPEKPSVLPRKPRPIAKRYSWLGRRPGIEAFLKRTTTLGFVVLHRGEIVHESYDLGADEESLLTSWSVAKSYLSALIGIAVEEGQIKSVNDLVTDYLPQLADSGYQGVEIRHLLQMMSGVAFDEDYDRLFSDINLMFMRGFLLGTGISEYPEGLESERPPGTRFHYISVDSQVLGMLLSKATGRTLSELLQEKIWQPLGMEGDAYWITDRAAPPAIEYGFCCLNARLRDYARFGQLFLDRGFHEGRAVVPASWVKQSTVPDREDLKLHDHYGQGWDLGYQYQWWVPDGDEGEFTAIGVWGEYIYVNRARQVVIAKFSADPGFNDRDLETIAAFRAIAHSLE